MTLHPDMLGRMTTDLDEDNLNLKGDEILRRTAQRIYELTEQFKNLKRGHTMREINRRISLAIWFEDGARQLMGKEIWNKFCEWMKSDRYTDGETINRAVRLLLKEGKIEVSAEAIRDAERKRARIENKLRSVG